MIDPKVSIVVTTYNRATLVGSAIDSLLNQATPPSEIIVVNDGSTDNTESVLRSYGDRIRFVTQANAGLSAARNRGITESSGDWVGFLDDDDTYWTGNARQPGFERYSEGRIGAFYWAFSRRPFIRVHAVNAEIDLAPRPPAALFQMRHSNEEIPTEECHNPMQMVLKSCFFAQSLIVRRDVFARIGMFRDTMHEDLDFCVRLASETPWYIEPNTLISVRRQTQTSLSADWRKKPVEKAESLVRIHHAATQLADKKNRTLARDCLGTSLYSLGMLKLRARQSGAYRDLMRAASAYPGIKSRMKVLLFAALGTLSPALLPRSRALTR